MLGSSKTRARTDTCRTSGRYSSRVLYLHPLHKAAREEGWPAIEALKGTQESLDLDFKCKVDPTKGQIDAKDREIIGRLVVAFANSMGGLAVIGVDCRPGTGDEPDEARDIKPIANIRRFATDVRANIMNFATARLEDVTIDHIEKPDGSGAGVLLISVGRSERRPHRCEVKGSKAFYRRSGASTIEMETFEIEDAFRRMSIARLEMAPPIHEPGGNHDVNVNRHYACFWLRNTSNMTAKFPHVQIVALMGGKVWPYGIDGSRTFHLNRHPTLGRNTFVGDANTVIHPGQDLEIFRIQYDVKIPGYDISYTDEKWPQGFERYQKTGLHMTIATSCENAPRLLTDISLPGAALLRLFGYDVPDDQ